MFLFIIISFFAYRYAAAFIAARHHAEPRFAMLMMFYLSRRCFLILIRYNNTVHHHMAPTAQYHGTNTVTNNITERHYHGAALIASACLLLPRYADTLEASLYLFAAITITLIDFLPLLSFFFHFLFSAFDAFRRFSLRLLRFRQF